MVQVKRQFLGARVTQGMQLRVELVHHALRVGMEHIQVRQSQSELRMGMDTPCVRRAQPVLQIKLA